MMAARKKLKRCTTSNRRVKTVREECKAGSIISCLLGRVIPPCFWSLQSAYCDWHICRNLLTGLHVSAGHRKSCLVESHAHKADARLIHSCKAAPTAGPCAVPVNGMIGSMPRQRPLPSARPLAPPPRGPHSGPFCASIPHQWGRPLDAAAWRLGKKNRCVRQHHLLLPVRRQTW